MKILYYSAHPHLNLSAPAGYGTHMREVINGLKELGHEVETLIIGGEVLSEDKTKFVRKSFLKKTIKFLIPAIIWETIKDYNLLKIDKKNEIILSRAVVSFQPDLIYERGYYLLQSGKNISIKYKIKHYLELNAPYVEERVSFSGNSFYINKAKIIEKEALEQASVIIVVSSALKQYFKKINPNSEEKILITPNAINTKTIRINLKEEIKIRKSLNIEHKTVIGFVGSIFPYHGVDMLIQAFATIKNIEKFTLLIIGNGETLADLKKLSQKLNLEKHIIFTGSIKHSSVFNYINLMDITVMPQSNWYGSPVKIFEYGYLKKPIIAPNYAPLKDVITNNKNGILIEPSILNLANAIERLASNKILSHKIGVQFHQDIIRKYTWKNVALNILSFVPNEK